MFHLAVLLLNLSSTHGPCELVANGLGQVFVLGSHFVTLNFPGILFHSLMASAEVNNAATVR